MSGQDHGEARPGSQRDRLAGHTTTPTSGPARHDRPSPAPLAEVVDLLLDQLTANIVAALACELPTAQPQPPAWALLNVQEAAARFHRSTRWVREQAKRGQLPFIRLDGGALAFELEDIQAFARARRIPADDPTTLANRLHTRRSATPEKRFRLSDRATDPEVA